MTTCTHKLFFTKDLHDTLVSEGVQGPLYQAALGLRLAFDDYRYGNFDFGDCDPHLVAYGNRLHELRKTHYFPTIVMSTTMKVDEFYRTHAEPIGATVGVRKDPGYPDLRVVSFRPRLGAWSVNDSNKDMRKFLRLFKVEPDEIFFHLRGSVVQLPQIDGQVDGDSSEDGEDYLLFPEYEPRENSYGPYDEEHPYWTRSRLIPTMYGLPRSSRTFIRGGYSKRLVSLGFPVYGCRQYRPLIRSLCDLLAGLKSIVKLGRASDFGAVERDTKSRIRRLLKEVVCSFQPYGRTGAPGPWRTRDQVAASGENFLTRHQLRCLKELNPLRQEISCLLRRLDH